MAATALDLAEITDRALVVSGLATLRASGNLTDDHIRYKLTIHFQKERNRGGEVSSVVYPLGPNADNAIIVFEQSQGQ